LPAELRLFIVHRCCESYEELDEIKIGFWSKEKQEILAHAHETRETL